MYIYIYLCSITRGKINTRSTERTAPIRQGGPSKELADRGVGTPAPQRALDEDVVRVDAVRVAAPPTVSLLKGYGYILDN